MNENLEKLLVLIQSNPELPVIPMVDSEIVIDGDCACWRGSWGMARIEEVYIGKDQIHFRDDEDGNEIDELMSEVLNTPTYNTMSHEQLTEAYKALPWRHCIVVYICTVPNNADELN